MDEKIIDLIVQVACIELLRQGCILKDYAWDGNNLILNTRMIRFDRELTHTFSKEQLCQLGVEFV